jgi:hypothetical protein
VCGCVGVWVWRCVGVWVWRCVGVGVGVWVWVWVCGWVCVLGWGGGIVCWCEIGAVGRCVCACASVCLTPGSGLSSSLSHGERCMRVPSLGISHGVERVCPFMVCVCVGVGDGGGGGRGDPGRSQASLLSGGRQGCPPLPMWTTIVDGDATVAPSFMYGDGRRIPSLAQACMRVPLWHMPTRYGSQLLAPAPLCQGRLPLCTWGDDWEMYVGGEAGSEGRSYWDGICTRRSTAPSRFPSVCYPPPHPGERFIPDRCALCPCFGCMIA